MKAITVKDVVLPQRRKRPDGFALVRYKLLSAMGIQINPLWKVIDIGGDFDADKRIAGTYYLTETELENLRKERVGVYVMEVKLGGSHG